MDYSKEKLFFKVNEQYVIVPLNGLSICTFVSQATQNCKFWSIKITGLLFWNANPKWNYVVVCV